MYEVWRVNRMIRVRNRTGRFGLEGDSLCFTKWSLAVVELSRGTFEGTQTWKRNVTETQTQGNISNQLFPILSITVIDNSLSSIICIIHNNV